MRDWLAQAGRDALATLPDSERGTSKLIGCVGQLLQDQGKFGEAEPLYRESFTARKETPGDKHPSTLISVSALVVLVL